MQGNFIMLQKDDLKQVVSELVEELVGKKTQSDLTPEESDEYYTRDQVCEGFTSPIQLCGVCRKREQLSFISWVGETFTQKERLLYL